MKTLARTLLKRPAWLYACVSALAVLVMAATSTIFAPQLQQWEERLSSRTWTLADSSATERRVVVVHARAGSRALTRTADPIRPGSPEREPFLCPQPPPRNPT